MLHPVIAMFLLTFAVWLFMYVQRFRYMAANKIKPQDIPTPEAIAKLLPDRINRSSDNFKNLFEMPVIFYAVSSLALSLHITDRVLMTMAWAFVLFRAIHSAIHCTVNHVPMRFLSYFVSSVILFGMIVRFATLA